MPWPVHPNGLLGAQGDQDTYRIERSLRFNSADSAYLSRTYGSGTSATTWTISCWVKRSSFGSATCIFSERLSSNANVVTQLDFQSSDTLRLVGTNTSGSVTLDLITTQVFRDPSAWFHLVVAADSTQATASERFKIYINGSQVTSLGTATYPAQNSTFGVFSASEHNIGRRFLAVSGTDALFNGYITEFHAIDGQALTPSSFGETDAITGRWKAKAYSGSYGTNGFYLKFADNSGTTSTTLGKDSSGNGNNWTPNNFSVTAGADNDSLVDSPTNYGTDTGVGGEVRGNYATLNPLDRQFSGATFSNGNINFSSSGANYGKPTIFPSSGKWYSEFTITAKANSTFNNFAIYINNDTDGIYAAYEQTGQFYNGSAWNGSAAYSVWATNGIVGVAIDLDAKTVRFYYNGAAQGSGAISISSNIQIAPVIFSNVSGNEIAANFGQRPFAYTAPTGFKAFCTTNLPTPTIQKPSSYMDVVTYTGNGATQTISSLGFSPDFLWSKSRSVGRSHRLIDSVRGIDNVLGSDTTAAEYTGSAISSFNSNGFSLKNADNYNINSETYVAWAWDAGETSSTNTAGSITSTVRVNAQAGVSIVGYTGNGTSGATIGHGLGVVPKMIITKKRSSSGDWRIYHVSIGNTNILEFTTAASIANLGSWNNTTPTSSVFSVGNSLAVNESGSTMIAYLFAEVEGFSKFGSYTGNGSADGPFVWCGFRPKWVMIKRTDAAGEHWQIQDSIRSISNPVQNNLFPNLSLAEQIGGADRDFDFVSNGFKLRGNNTGTNASGGTYIFAAFAESPFKYARAR